MSPLDKLIAYFEKFPGVGIRQAKRFAFHILTLPENDKKEIASLITSLADSVRECVSCRRFFSSQRNNSSRCAICEDVSRDVGKLLVVARDSDIDVIERTHLYDGYYFVLGGMVSLLDQSDTKQKLRAGGLRSRVSAISQGDAITEVILAFAVNPDGDNTARYVEKLLRELGLGDRLKISHLARGLSTGSELEYADPDTIREALEHRL